MQNMNYKLNFSPNQNHQSQIREWLIEENENSGEGFLCNWSVISKAFNENRVITFTEKDFPIGFLVYRKSELILNIVIAEIKPSHRRKGIGKLLINETFEKFKNKGILVSELSCSPASSERIWLKLGFINFPESNRWNGEILMYKPLIENLEPDISRKLKTKNSIMILTEYSEFVAKWELKFKNNSRKLLKPIIFPVHYRWKLNWIENEVTIFNNEIDRMINKVRDENFIIITELKI
jgi:predicted GNAT family acetyltransferase